MGEMENNRRNLSLIIERWYLIAGVSFFGYAAYMFFYCINTHSIALLVVPCVALGTGIGLYLRMKLAILISKIFLCGFGTLLILGMANPFVISESRNLARFYICSSIAILVCGTLLGLITKGQKQRGSR